MVVHTKRGSSSAPKSMNCSHRNRANSRIVCNSPNASTLGWSH